ncbi:MAG: TatD family hydrolase [Pseudobdellovibrionaceae bacterium]
MKTYSDSHSHLSDLRIESEVESMIQRAKSRGITKFLQGGVGPEDWERQRALKAKHPEIRLCFGLHPYWIADHSDEECEQALNRLAREIGQAEALGELGLDLRPHILKDSMDRQLEFFQAQLELAEVAGKPVVLHLVRAFHEAEKIFDLWGVPPRAGMVHSFNGSRTEAESYLKRGFFLSIGGPVVRPDNLKLHQAVQIIPLEKLLVETDSPDQPPPGWQGGWNEPVSLWDVAEKIAELKKLTAEEVLDISSQNLEKMLTYADKRQSQFQF